MNVDKKVQELLSKEYRMDFWDCYNDEPNTEEWMLEQAIENSLIVVGEVLKQWEYIDTYLGNGNGELNPNLKYWQEVNNKLLKMKKDVDK